MLANHRTYRNYTSHGTFVGCSAQAAHSTYATYGPTHDAWGTD